MRQTGQIILASVLLGGLGCASRIAPPSPPKPTEESHSIEVEERFLERAEARYQEGVDHYRAGQWKAAASLFDRTLRLLDRKQPGDFHDLRIRRSLALLRAKTVYYGDRCAEQEETIEFSTPQETAQPSIPFPRAVNPQVNRWIEYFQGEARQSFTRWLERCGRYEAMMKGVLAEENLPTQLFHVPLIESGMNPHAYSRAHAVGTWQFIRSTGRLYGLRSDWWYDDRRDPEMACRAAAKHLKDLYESLGDWYLALAAYNCGEARVKREIRRLRTTDFWRLRGLPRQTRDYVPKFLAATEIAKHPARYGFYFVPDPPIEYETIQIHETVSMEAIAHCAGTSVAEIELLNPAIRRSVTPPTRSSFHLNLPIGSSARVERCLRCLPTQLRVTWEEYRVRQGDTLSKIAGRFRTTITALSDINKLRSRHRIRAGQTLLIPRRTKARVPPSAPPASSRVQGAASSGGARFQYLVRKGDTLTRIARQFSVGLTDLQRWNSLSSSDLIHPGDPLVVLLSAQTADNFGLGRMERGPLFYTVRRGDTLEAISRRHGVSARDLAKWNGMSVRETIYPGNRLKVYPADRP